MSITLSTPQARIFECKARFRAVVAGRRFGKTTLALVVGLMDVCRPDIKDRVVWYVAPSYRQAAQIAWKALKNLVPHGWVTKINETDLALELRNGCVFALRGSDNYESLRGVGLDGLILDEYADMAPEVWSEVLRPALSDRQGWALFIGSPKGFNHFHTLWTRAFLLEGWESFRFTTLDGGRVPPEEIETARAELDSRSFRQEYEASFEAMTGLVYQNFDRTMNVRADLKDTGGTLLVGLDFNVAPMAAVIGVRAGDQLHILDEITIQNGNTPLMIEEIKRRYPERKISVFPDPSGQGRRTSAPVGQTDHSLLRAAGFQVLAPHKAPPVVDRINEVNAMFRNAKAESRLFISSKCQVLIHCLEGLTYRDGTSEPDKRLGLDHHVDALGYLVHSEFPLVSRRATSHEFRI